MNVSEQGEGWLIFSGMQNTPRNGSFGRFPRKKIVGPDENDYSPLKKNGYSPLFAFARFI
jgi:hypothetical protein